MYIYTYIYTYTHVYMHACLSSHRIEDLARGVIIVADKVSSFLESVSHYIFKGLTAGAADPDPIPSRHAPRLRPRKAIVRRQSVWTSDLLEGSPRGPLGALGGLVGRLERSKSRGCSRGASWDGPGRRLRCFWRYGAILGSDLRSLHVFILLVLDGFLICTVIYVFLIYV